MREGSRQSGWVEKRMKLRLVRRSGLIGIEWGKETEARIGKRGEASQ